MQRQHEPGRVVISFKVKPDLKAELAELARQDHRTLSAYIELALMRHVDKAARMKEKANG